MRGWTDTIPRYDQMRYWPVEQRPAPFALYVCGCGFKAKVAPTLTFIRVAHLCWNKDRAVMVK